MKPLVIPLAEIVSEPLALAVFDKRHTQEHFFTGAAVVLASIATFWGAQVLSWSPTLVISPSAFCGIMLFTRLFEEFLAKAVIRRDDLIWAVDNVLLSLRTTALTLVALLVVEAFWFPILTQYFKLVYATIAFCSSMLMFFIPGAYVFTEPTKCGKTS